MNNSTRSEINSCVSELLSIVSQLNEVSRDIQNSIRGMNTQKFVNSLEETADKYKKAAVKLRKIK